MQPDRNACVASGIGDRTQRLALGRYFILWVCVYVHCLAVAGKGKTLAEMIGLVDRVRCMLVDERTCLVGCHEILA